MILKVIFAIILIGLSTNLIATQSMYHVLIFYVKTELIRSIRVCPCFKSATMTKSDRYRGSVNITSYAETGGLWRRDVQHMAQAKGKCSAR